MLRLAPPVLANGATEAKQREFVRRFAPDPLSNTDGQSWAEFEAACRAEGCDLLNPYVDDPEEHFAWEADAVLREVAVRPENAASRRFQEAAEMFYGLNEEASRVRLLAKEPSR